MIRENLNNLYKILNVEDNGNYIIREYVFPKEWKKEILFENYFKRMIIKEYEKNKIKYDRYPDSLNLISEECLENNLHFLNFDKNLTSKINLYLKKLIKEMENKNKFNSLNNSSNGMDAENLVYNSFQIGEFYSLDNISSPLKLVAKLIPLQNIKTDICFIWENEDKKQIVQHISIKKHVSNNESIIWQNHVRQEIMAKKDLSKQLKFSNDFRTQNIDKNQFIKIPLGFSLCFKSNNDWSKDFNYFDVPNLNKQALMSLNIRTNNWKGTKLENVEINEDFKNLDVDTLAIVSNNEIKWYSINNSFWKFPKKDYDIKACYLPANYHIRIKEGKLLLFVHTDKHIHYLNYNGLIKKIEPMSALNVLRNNKDNYIKQMNEVLRFFKSNIYITDVNLKNRVDVNLYKIEYIIKN